METTTRWVNRPTATLQTHTHTYTFLVNNQKGLNTHITEYSTEYAHVDVYACGFVDLGGNMGGWGGVEGEWMLLVWQHVLRLHCL